MYVFRLNDFDWLFTKHKTWKVFYHYQNDAIAQDIINKVTCTFQLSGYKNDGHSKGHVAIMLNQNSPFGGSFTFKTYCNQGIPCYHTAITIDVSAV